MPETQTSITLNKKSNTILTLNTEGKYIDRNLQFNLNAREADVTMNSSSVISVDNASPENQGINIYNSVGAKSLTEPADGYFIKLNNTNEKSITVNTAGWIENGNTQTTQTTEYYPINEASFNKNCQVTIVPTATVRGENVTLVDNNTGVYVVLTGGGEATAVANFSSSEAGYIDRKALGSAQAETENTTTFVQFLSGVTLTTPETDRRSFSVTVPNGNSTVNFMFSVDANGNVLVE